MKNSVTYLAMCLALAATMWAQSSNSSDTTQSGSSNTQMRQSQSSDNGQNSIEGCIVKRETAFYIQPKSGPATQLDAGSQDLNSHVGQDVRVTGSQQSSSSSQTSTGASSGTSAQGDFLVSRVDVVAAACPTDTQQGGTNQQNPPK